MDKIAVNCITLQYLLEFAKMLHAIATNTTVIRNFFKKIRQADPGYMKMYRSEVDAFRERLCKRAREKRQAAVDDMEALAKQKRIAESPGGLDPQEVLDSLPQVVVFYILCCRPKLCSVFEMLVNTIYVKSAHTSTPLLFINEISSITVY